LPCLVAVHQDASGQGLGFALAWAKGIGGGRAGIIETTFARETETDLFGEQASVVGGVTAIMQAAFETLVEAGYEPHEAYLECVHEVKFVVDLIHKHGLAGMGRHISRTALYGGLTSGGRIAAAVRPVMREILHDIRCGAFARSWMAEHDAGCPRIQARKRQDQVSPLETVGRDLRDMMP